MKEDCRHANTQRWRWIPKIREKDHGKEKQLFWCWEKDGEQKKKKGKIIIISTESSSKDGSTFFVLSYTG